MPTDSPSVVLFDSNSVAHSVQNGVAIPSNTPALIVAGSDGTNSRYIVLDSSGRPVIVGAGTAGTPAGGIVSVQGVSGGTTIRIDPIGTTTQPVKETRSTISSLSSVAGSATSVTLLVSNTSRLKCTVVNDNTTVLYVKFGTTASATSYTYKLLPHSTLTEDKWTGIIEGIWASAGSGSARITELTA